MPDYRMFRPRPTEEDMFGLGPVSDYQPNEEIIASGQDAVNMPPPPPKQNFWDKIGPYMRQGTVMGALAGGLGTGDYDREKQYWAARSQARLANAAERRASAEEIRAQNAAKKKNANWNVQSFKMPDGSVQNIPYDQYAESPPQIPPGAVPYKSQGDDRTITPFETWQQQNPGKDPIDWVKANAAANAQAQAGAQSGMPWDAHGGGIVVGDKTVYPVINRRTGQVTFTEVPGTTRPGTNRPEAPPEPMPMQEFIADFRQEYGRPPTEKEIGKAIAKGYAIPE